jgi:hypothetical protein
MNRGLFDLSDVRWSLACWLMVGCLVGKPVTLPAAELHVGAATVDITPEQPVALDGQRNVRISKTPATRIYAAVLALESRDGDRVLDQAIMVSCDLVAIRQGHSGEGARRNWPTGCRASTRRNCSSAPRTRTPRR